MTEPPTDAMMRAVTALMPFVQAYRLSVNPENVEQMAYAVLRHAYSEESFTEIHDAVTRQLAEEAADHARLTASYRTERSTPPAETEGGQPNRNG